jgi:hypothetical protein
LNFRTSNTVDKSILTSKSKDSNPSRFLFIVIIQYSTGTCAHELLFFCCMLVTSSLCRLLLYCTLYSVHCTVLSISGSFPLVLCSCATLFPLCASVLLSLLRVSYPLCCPFLSTHLCCVLLYSSLFCALLVPICGMLLRYCDTPLCLCS